MTDPEMLDRSLERALALAYAALEDPTEARLAASRESAREVLAAIKKISRERTLAEARRTLMLVNQLRAVLRAIEPIEMQNHPRAARSS
jgi:hypothetical protein